VKNNNLTIHKFLLSFFPEENTRTLKFLNGFYLSKFKNAGDKHWHVEVYSASEFNEARWKNNKEKSLVLELP